MTRVFPLTLIVLLLVACGSGHRAPSRAVDYRPLEPGPDVTKLANQRERRAGREAEKLLRQLSLPPGAVRLRAPALSNRMANPGLGVSVMNMTAARFSLWRVPRSSKSVLAFEKRHMLSGLRSAGGGSGLDGFASAQFFAPIVRGLPSQREVSVTVEPRRGGSTLRLDAGVSWIYPRSPQEAVPAGVHAIDIHGGGVDVHVTARRTVARILRLFAALHVAQPGPAVGCALVIAPHVHIAFRSAGGATLARAATDGSPATNCNSIEFAIRGKRQLPLIDARMGRYTFIEQLQRLLGHHFSDEQLR
jgi:hypothetical protein